MKIVLISPVTSNKTPSILKKEENREHLQKNGFISMTHHDRTMILPQKFFDERAAIDQDELFQDNNVPVHIIHGTEDASVDHHISEQLHEKYPEKVGVTIIEGADHDFNEHSDEMADIVISEIKS